MKLSKFLLFLFTFPFLYFIIVFRVRNICKRPLPSFSLNSICFDNNETTTRSSKNFFGKCLPPLLPFDSKFRLSEPFMLASCVIEKNMSTILAAIMCFLRDSGAFLTAGTLTDNNYEQRFCKGQNEFGTIEAFLTKNQTQLKDWRLLAIVRDPFERFLSGYIDKCLNEANKTSAFRRIVCYNCNSTDLACFVRRQFRRAQMFAEQGGRPRIYWTFEDIHFFPQNWHCQFHSNFAHFRLIHFGETADGRVKMYADLIDWLQANGVPGHLLQIIQSQIAQRQTGHSTREEPIRGELRQKLLGDKELRRMLLRMFYFDYVLFDLPFEHLID